MLGILTQGLNFGTVNVALPTVIQQNNPGFQALRYTGVHRMNPEGLNGGDDYHDHDHTR
jgi:hypothetical protein